MANTHAFFLVPTSPGVGLTSVCLGLLRALDQAGVRVAFVKPIRQPGKEDGPERSTHFVRATTALTPPDPIPFERAAAMVSSGKLAELLQEVVGRYRAAADGADVVIVEGLVATGKAPFLDTLNAEVIRALDAEVILVGTTGEGTAQGFADRMQSAAQQYGGTDRPKVIGAIANMVNAPIEDIAGSTRTERKHPEQPLTASDLAAAGGPFAEPGFQLFGAVPWQQSMVSPRTMDVARQLGAVALYEGESATRRVVDVSLVARTVANMTHRLRPDALLVTPYDRDDVILAVAMAAANGVPLAGLVLTGAGSPNATIMELCEPAIATGLPVLQVTTDSYVTAARAAAIDVSVPIDDVARIESVMDTVARYLDTDALLARVARDREPRVSPPAFLYRLVERARAVSKRIVLPEGEEPRTVRAAVDCVERGIARCLLLGDPAAIRRVATAQGLTLGAGIELLEPTDALQERYVEAMVALRSHKGLSADGARNQLRDPVVLATMMLAQGEVDGLVSGAVHTTASTVLPALQLIKTRADAVLVSSVFFMCLPDQVLVYGDCAINPDPTAVELADIAVQSADSARAFGIEPRVAMLSYATGESGSGTDVDKVREATLLAQQRRPGVLIEGPMQYDAAMVPEVARLKAPDSLVAGRATVFIFPDLNSGNSTYKAVQRSANVVSVGPMLQGLRRPVNDLSRGAMVEDIVYTIALTAIQADQVERLETSAAAPEGGVARG